MLTLQSALLPLAAQYFFTPLDVFSNILPTGYDTVTDGLKKSLRVEIANQTAAHCTYRLAVNTEVRADECLGDEHDHSTDAQRTS
jgi:hypothetical protein